MLYKEICFFTIDIDSIEEVTEKIGATIWNVNRLFLITYFSGKIRKNLIIFYIDQGRFLDMSEAGTQEIKIKMSLFHINLTSKYLRMDICDSIW